jgi:hypothetical protein
MFSLCGAAAAGVEILCCTMCVKALYESHGVTFLTDESDTIAAYEERGKQMSDKSSYDKGIEALQSMNRVQQVELVHGKCQLQFFVFNRLQPSLESKLKPSILVL